MARRRRRPEQAPAAEAARPGRPVTVTIARATRETPEPRGARADETPARRSRRRRPRSGRCCSAATRVRPSWPRLVGRGRRCWPAVPAARCCSALDGARRAADHGLVNDLLDVDRDRMGGAKNKPIAEGAGSPGQRQLRDRRTPAARHPAVAPERHRGRRCYLATLVVGLRAQPLAARHGAVLGGLGGDLRAAHLLRHLRRLGPRAPTGRRR